jgi:hypothetical protein
LPGIVSGANPFASTIIERYNIELPQREEHLNPPPTASVQWENVREAQGNAIPVLPSSAVVMPRF